MSSRTGKTAHDIFSPTRVDKKTPPSIPEPRTVAEDPAPALDPEPVGPIHEQVRRGPGRPPVHDERWAKATVILLNRHIVFLDRLSSDIREKTGRAIKRAELIRALIEMLSESDIDLTSATSEADIKARLVQAVAS